MDWGTMDISLLMGTVRALVTLAEDLDGMDRATAMHTASVLAEDMASMWEPDLFDDDEQALLTSLLNNVH
jgi:hypothetical protein|tara:strand:+ start:1167 stop:1376 length:210 start_codon:yes stop_codon:yes gene_type:complete